MNDFLTRLVDEQLELQSKLEKLSDFYFIWKDRKCRFRSAAIAKDASICNGSLQ